MSDKYIIKNCPNLTTSHYGTGETIHNQCGLTDDDLCANCTDCLLKQIAERCKKVGKCTADICTNPYEYATYCVTRGVLQLLEIEECE